MVRLNMVQAINLALQQEMRRDPDVLILGQDVGLYGGVFRVTEGLQREFGPERVIDTPLAESGIVGSAIGMALYGLKPVCEIQFSGFCYQAFHQLEQHAARFRNRTRGRYHCPLVVRMPYGGGIRALEHHSESREAYFAHTPGLKMVIPSTPRKAHALLAQSIRDPDPVIFFEPKSLYRAFREKVGEDGSGLELGQADVVRQGSDVTVVCYGAMVWPALQAAELVEKEDGVQAEVIDLLTVSPLDEQTVLGSVRNTGRAVVVHEAPRNCGVGAEVSARLMENVFLHLEAPVQRVTGYDVQMPYFVREKFYIPNPERIVRALRKVLSY